MDTYAAFREALAPILLAPCSAFVEVIRPIGDLTLQYFQPFYAWVDGFSTQVRVSPEITLLVLVLLSSFVLGFIQRFFLPRTPIWLRHLYAGGIGLLISFLCYGYHAWHSVVTCLVTYLSMLVLPHGISHRFVTAFVFGYLSCCHLYRMTTNYLGTKTDYSGMQMMMTFKLFIIAVNYYDGSFPEDQRNPRRAKYALKQLPTPLEFLGYCYFYPAVLTGPVYEMKHYLDSIRQYGFRQYPSCTKAFITRIFYMTISILGFVFGIPLFSRDFVWNGQFFSYPMWYKLIFGYMLIQMFKFRYYMVWYIAETSCMLAGMGFSGVDAKMNPLWEETRQIDMVSFETARNSFQLAASWNMSIARALKHYTYSTGGASKAGPWNVIMVFVLSAIWHGFYPGYYLFFLHLAFATLLAQMFRRKMRPVFVTKQIRSWRDLTIPLIGYHVIAWFIMHYFVNLTAAAFALLSVGPTIKFWSAYYYYPQIGIICVFFLYFLIPHPTEQQRKDLAALEAIEKEERHKKLTPPSNWRQILEKTMENEPTKFKTQ